MNFMKKQTAGSGITFVAFVLSIAAIIVYFVNINSVGYFENAAVPEAVLYNVIGIVLLAVILVLSQLLYHYSTMKRFRNQNRQTWKPYL